MLRTAPIALCLAVPMIAAAKPVIDNEGHAWLSMTLMGTRATDQPQKLEVESWQWGPARSGGSNELRLNDTAGGANSAVETQRKELVAESRMQDSRRSGGHSMLGASDKTTIHDPPPPRDGGLGSESERTFVAPHVFERGTLTVKANLPGCVVGKRYAGMQFGGGGMSSMRYELKDVVISNCAPGEVTFSYAKVIVRGWDPKKKEE